MHIFKSLDELRWIFAVSLKRVFLTFPNKKQPRYLYCPITNLSQKEHLAFFNLCLSWQMYVVVGKSKKLGWLFVVILDYTTRLLRRYDPVDRSTALSLSLWEYKNQMLLVLYHTSLKANKCTSMGLWCTHEYENMSPFSKVLSGMLAGVKVPLLLWTRPTRAVKTDRDKNVS